MNAHKPNIKIIVLDLDGTLLNSNKEISSENYEALERAANAGVHIVPCTGRFYDGMPEAVRQLPFVRYAITVNGAEIYDAREKKVLHSALIPSNLADRVFAYMDTLPVIYDCFQDGWGWMDQKLYEKADGFTKDPHMLDMIRMLRTPIADFRQVIRSRGRGIQKTQMFFQDLQLRQQVLETFSQRFPELIATSSMVNNVEINSRDANKGEALRQLCLQLGVDLQDTMAFGDGLNDVTMLRAAGIGVAMGNADASIQAEADFVTDTNDNHGVAKAVHRFCFGQ